MNPTLLSWIRIPELPEGTPRLVRLMPPDLEAENKSAAARRRWSGEKRSEMGKRISDGKRRAALLRELAEIDKRRVRRRTGKGPAKVYRIKARG